MRTAHFDVPTTEVRGPALAAGGGGGAAAAAVVASLEQVKKASRAASSTPKRKNSKSTALSESSRDPPMNGAEDLEMKFGLKRTMRRRCSRSLASWRKRSRPWNFERRCVRRCWQ